MRKISAMKFLRKLTACIMIVALCMVFTGNCLAEVKDNETTSKTFDSPFMGKLDINTDTMFSSSTMRALLALLMFSELQLHGDLDSNSLAALLVLGKTVIADMPGGYVACCVSDIRSLYVIYKKSEKTITWDDLGPSVPLNLVTDPLSKEGASWYNVSVSDLNDAAKLLGELI